MLTLCNASRNGGLRRNHSYLVICTLWTGLRNSEGCHNLSDFLLYSKHCTLRLFSQTALEPWGYFYFCLGDTVNIINHININANHKNL